MSYSFFPIKKIRRASVSPDNEFLVLRLEDLPTNLSWFSLKMLYLKPRQIKFLEAKSKPNSSGCKY